MTAGLTIFRDDGAILIDENHSNLALSVKSSFTLPPNGIYTSSFGAGAFQYPLVAVLGAGVIQSQYMSVDGSCTLGVTGVGGASVTAYIFDVPTGAANYGLVVFKSDGSLAFDATKKYARIVDTWAGSDFTTGTRSYAAGRTYAVAMAKVGYYRDFVTIPVLPGDPGYNEFISTDQYGSQETTVMTTVTVSGASVTVGSKSTTYTPTPVPKGFPRSTYSSKDWVLLVLDVTNF